MFLSDSPNSIEEAEMGVTVLILKKVKQRLWDVKTLIQSHMTNKCQSWDQKQSLGLWSGALFTVKVSTRNLVGQGASSAWDWVSKSDSFSSWWYEWVGLWGGTWLRKKHWGILDLLPFELSFPSPSHPCIANTSLKSL